MKRKYILAIISVLLSSVLFGETYAVEKVRADYYEETEIIEELPYIEQVQKYYEACGYTVERTTIDCYDGLIITESHEPTIQIKFDDYGIIGYSIGDSYAEYLHGEYGVEQIVYGKGEISQEYYYQYDTDGNLTSAADYCENTYTNGVLTSTSYYNGDIVEYMYDSDGNMSAIKYNGNTVFKYTHNGNVVTEHNVLQDTYTTYTQTDDEKTAYGDFGMFSTTTEESCVTKSHDFYFYGYSHNVIATPNGITVDGVTTNYLKDYYGMIYSYGNYSVGYLYDEMREGTVNNVAFGDKGYKYDYDGVRGNLCELEYCDRFGGVSYGSIYYEYDDENRLIREDNRINDRTYIYDYDDYGNVSITVYEGGRLIRDSKRTISEDGYDVSYCGKPVDYDGYYYNPIYWNGYEFTWEYGNRLTAISGDGYNITYQYDVDGSRIGKIVNDIPTNYYLEDGKVIYESRGYDDEVIYYFYDYYDNLAGFVYDDHTYYYVYDGIQNIVGITDENGEVVVEYFYSAYGETLAVCGDKADTIGRLNPYRYKGYRYDEETGLYYLNSRYYSPETGRFIGTDDISSYTSNPQVGTCYNAYAYANNNPIKYYDPDGCVAVAVIGGVTIGVKAIIAASAVICIALLVLSYPAIKSFVENVVYSDLVDFFNACKSAKLKFWEKWRKSPRLCTHHVVARTDMRADKTREIVKKAIDDIVTDERNLVRIKERFHQKLHTRNYYEFQYNCFKPFEGYEKKNVEGRIKILNMLKIQKTIISIVNYTA